MPDTTQDKDKNKVKPEPTKSGSRFTLDPDSILKGLALPDDAEVDPDLFEAEAIKHTDFYKEMGGRKAELFFNGMTTRESSGSDNAVGTNPRGVKARGKWQISDETAAGKYGMDSTNPVVNRFMGVDYWNEGYKKAAEFSKDPVEKAAIATAYYHGGPGALDKIRKQHGQFSSVSDGGATTNDHVWYVLENWKKNMDKEGLDFTPTPGGMTISLEDKSLPQEAPTSGESKDIVSDASFFSGKLKNMKDPNAPIGPEVDERSRMLTMKLDFTPEEENQWASAKPEQKSEMLMGAYANSWEDRTKAMEAMRKIRDLNPQVFDQMAQEQVGPLNEVDVDTAVPRLIEAYIAGGDEGFKKENSKISVERNQFKLDQERYAAESQGMVDRTTSVLRWMEKNKRMSEDENGFDDLDIVAVNGLMSATSSLMGGLEGIAGATAGRFGLHSADRYLTRRSDMQAAIGKALYEEEELLKKRSMIPGAVLSAGKTLGAAPVILGSAALGGVSGLGEVSGVYVATIAQNSREEPLKAITLTMTQSLFAGAGFAGVAEGQSFAVAKGLAADSIANALQTTPDFAKNAAVLLYAKNNPNKVSKEELQKANEELKRLSNDLVGNLVVGAGFGVLGMAGAKVRKIAELPENQPNRGIKVAYDDGTIGKKVAAPATATIVAETPSSGAIKSIETIITSPESLVDSNGDPIGRVYTGADPVVGVEGDLYLAHFTDRNGKVLPSELISKEGMELYDAKLKRIAELQNKGASQEEVVAAIIDAQPKAEELQAAKVEAKIAAAEKAGEIIPFDTVKAKFDENIRKSEELRAQIKQQLEGLKKYPEEPDAVTELRKGLQETSTGQQMNSGMDVVAQAIVYGYDLYKTVKDYAQWSLEMVKQFGDFAKPYLEELWSNYSKAENGDVSKLNGLTPRNIETGELLLLNKPIRAQAGEAGAVNIQAIIDTASDFSEWANKFGRNANRFFVARGKGIAASGIEISSYIAEIDKSIADINAELLTKISVSRDQSLRNQLSKLQSDRNAAATALANNPKDSTQGKSTASKWVQSLSAGVKSKAMLLEFNQKAEPILKSMGSSIDEYYRYRQQDRLEGIRSRYRDWKNSVASMTDDDLIFSFTRHTGVDFYNALKAINRVQKGIFTDANAMFAMVERAAGTGDFTTVRSELERNFAMAEYLVPKDVFIDYNNYRKSPALQTVNSLYKASIEDILREKFEATDSMPSKYLGNDNLYFPLTVEEASTPGVAKKKKTFQAFKSAEFAKPKSPAARFATGLGADYSTNAKLIQESIAKQIRAGDRASLIQHMFDVGLARERMMIKDNNGNWTWDDIPEGYVPRDGTEYRRYSSKKSLQVKKPDGTFETVNYNKEFSPLQKQILIPEEAAKDLDILMSSQDLSERQITQALGRITGLAIYGPLEGVMHSWNVIDGLRAKLGFMPSDLFAAKSRSGRALAYIANKALGAAGKVGAIPGIDSLVANPIFGAFLDPRSIYGLAKVMEYNVMSKDKVKNDKSWQTFLKALKAGIVPERWGHVTFSVEASNAMGGELVGPMQWKVMRKLFKQVEPVHEPGAFHEGGWAATHLEGTKTGEVVKFAKKVVNTASLGPIVFGPSGLDIRARMAVAEALQHYNPDLTPMEIFETTQTLGIYNRFAESQIGGFLKRTQIAPFYSAASARARRVFQAWNPMMFAGAATKEVRNYNRREDKSLTQKAAFTAAKIFSENMYSYIAMWAIAHHAYSGQWPWDDDDSKFLEIQVKPEDIQTSPMLQMLSPDPSKKTYVKFAPQFGGTSGGSLYGINEIYKKMMRTADSGATFSERTNLALKAGLAQSVTGAIHVFGSGPMVHILPKATLGVDMGVYYKVKPAREGGGGEVSFYQHSGPHQGAIGRQVLGAILDVNSFVGNVAETIDMSPNHKQIDSPVSSDLLRMVTQWSTKNAIATQENPATTRKLYLDSILQGRLPKPQRKGR